VSAIACTVRSAHSTAIVSAAIIATLTLATASAQQPDAVELLISSGHRAKVEYVALAQGGTIAISSNLDRVKLWDVATGHLIHDMKRVFKLSAEGTRLLFHPAGKSVYLWDLATTQGPQALPLAMVRGLPDALVLAPDGPRAITFNTLRYGIDLWAADTGKRLASLEGHTGGVRTLAASADGRRLVSASYDKTVRVWDIASGRTVGAIGVDAWVVAISRDGERVLTGEFSSQVAKLWDAGGKLVRELRGHEHSVRSLAFSPDGARLATGGSDGDIVVWNAASGERLYSLASGFGGDVRALSFSSDGARVVSGHENGRVQVWNASAGERLRSIAESASQSGEAQFSSDGARILTSTGKVWDAATGALRHEIKKPRDRTVVFSPDGKHALTEQDKTVVLWDAASGKELRRFDYPSGAGTLAFSLDGALAAAGGGKEIALWDVRSGALVRRFSAQSDQILPVALSPDGSRLAAGDHDLTLWNVGTGTVIRSQKMEDRIDRLQFTPNGSRLVGRGYYSKCIFPVGLRCPSFQYHRVYRSYLWNVESGAQLATFDDGASALAPDGQLLATGTYGSAVALWRLADAVRVGTLSGVTPNVLAFSSDSRRVLGGDSDGTVTMWEAQTGKLLRSFRAHTSRVKSVAFSPDGRRMDRVHAGRLLRGGTRRRAAAVGGQGVAPRRPRRSGPTSASARSAAREARRRSLGRRARRRRAVAFSVIGGELVSPG
jgi:WD40 repeat protein